MESRKQRKLEAKQNNEVFVPQYNGTGVLTFEDYYGVGNERFNNKFVAFDKPQEEVVEEIVNEEVTEPLVEDAVIAEEKVEIVEAEIVEETPKSKKAKKESKFKKKLKKLFNK